MNKTLIVIIFIIFNNILYSQELKLNSMVEINNLKYILKQKDSSHIFIEKDGKIILSDSSYTYKYSKFELIDFNNDKKLDFKITYIWSGNDDSDNRFILYLSENDTLKKIKDFNDYENVIHLKENYYYSYQEMGVNAVDGGTVSEEHINCVKLNWRSYLFKIENEQISRLASIIGEGCSRNNTKDLRKIQVNKLTKNEDMEINVIEEFSYLESFVNLKKRKEFIGEYWINNYEKFQLE